MEKWKSGKRRNRAWKRGGKRGSGRWFLEGIWNSSVMFLIKWGGGGPGGGGLVW